MKKREMLDSQQILDGRLLLMDKKNIYISIVNLYYDQYTLLSKICCENNSITHLKHYFIALHPPIKTLYIASRARLVKFTGLGQVVLHISSKTLFYTFLDHYNIGLRVGPD